MKDFTVVCELLMEKEGWSRPKVTARKELIEDVLLVLAETPEEITLVGVLKELKEKLEKKMEDVSYTEIDQRSRERELSRREWRLQDEQRITNELIAKNEVYVKQINQCETAEMRDRMRAAILYAETAQPAIGYRTKESYTFVEGLSRILSGGKPKAPAEAGEKKEAKE